MAGKKKQLDGIAIGVDYYPEQWKKEMWVTDADNMAKAGVKVVRMAEFAWSRLEPVEGVYEFEWLDEVIQLFSDRNIRVFLCTPTCTPPQWLYEKYPKTIQVGKDGQRIAIGIRGHRCMNSPVYRKFCEKIIKKMVERYKDNPWVIGYQIDNELEANHCRCDICNNAFRSWVKKKYRTVEAVNEAYGNSVWSGEYSDFSQVNPPMGDFVMWQNPSLTLDYNRYASDSTVDYVEFQRNLIHGIDAEALITTNNWLCENMPDFYHVFEHLDFVSYDNYPTTKLPKNSEELYSHAFHLDLMRGIKNDNFWIMEQLSGTVGSWMPMLPAPRPGMLKGYALQAIAHGADAVVHFRWRTAVSGAEMYWHGILDHHGELGRRYQEFVSLCEEVEKIKDYKGTKAESSVAIFYDSDQEYVFKLQHQAEGMYYLEQLKSLHDAFTALGIGVDIISERSDIKKYQIVVAPTLQITHSDTVKKLYEFAENGGTVVLTNRCGVKDIYNKCIMKKLPGDYAELTGVQVEEYDVIGNDKLKLRVNEELLPAGEQEMAAACTQWCDILEVNKAQTLVTYDEEFYAGKAAVTQNQYGKGRAYYIGTVLNRAMYIALARKMVQERNMSYIPDLPLGVEVTHRSSQNRRITFIFNNTDKVQSFSYKDKIMTLEPFEMKVEEKGD